jgi:predicted unusual protein kinase regulating ubiquinone biosynthesis (AarF/ABC1/UbiB family)
MLKRVLRPTKYHRVFSDCLPEVERKVQEELDYRREAQYTTLFRGMMDADAVVLPEVIPSLSTSRVLTTTRISGRHLGEWLAEAPPQSARDHFGQQLVDFMNRSVFTYHTLHADPNPGNYFFMADGRLGVVDFGCVVTLEHAFVDAVSGLLRYDAPLDTQVEEMLHNTAGIHYRTDRREGFVPFFKAWVRWLKEPFHPGGYDFGANSDYFERGNAFFDEYRRYIDHYDSRFIYYGRTLHGILRILQQLRARVIMAPPA